jgi:hypothetical protein
MGVMSCSRKNCDNIMCDTYVKSIGYVCSDCISEFKEYLQKNDLNPRTEGQINKELEKFMATSKETYSYMDDVETTVDNFFNERTR